VADLVNARSTLGLRVSANQLRGRLHERIGALKEDLAQVAALVAAGIDFPEEDVTFFHRDEIRGTLQRVQGELQTLVARSRQGRLVREGLAVAIVGRPNVGKSSLLNALLRDNRAIVTEVPGTTRDTLEESTEIGGVALRLIDTAGIRDTRDVVEREGISRSNRAIAQADLVLLVLDGSAPLQAEDEALLRRVSPQATLVVVNKQDLLGQSSAPWIDRLDGLAWRPLSALTGEGLERLEAWVLHWALGEDRPLLEEALITNMRQEQAAQRALAAVGETLGALGEEAGDELLAIDLQRGLDALGDIVGQTTADDLLGRIFSRFCIGK
jgi:tRNA modification GTPase